MERFDWRLTGLLAVGVLVGLLLLVVAWKAAKLVFKVFIALLFLILLGLGAWYGMRQAG